MTSRFDDLPWREEDRIRATRTDKRFRLFGAVIEYRCDWPEHCDVTRLKRWGARCPCPKCRCRLHDMHTKYHGCSAVALPWDERTTDDYVDELTRQIIKVQINEPDQHARLLASLRFRHAHPWGRCVSRELPEFDLKRDDSLVCNEVVPHLHALEAFSGSMRVECLCVGSFMVWMCFMLTLNV